MSSPLSTKKVKPLSIRYIAKELESAYVGCRRWG